MATTLSCAWYSRPPRPVQIDRSGDPVLRCRVPASNSDELYDRLVRMIAGRFLRHKGTILGLEEIPAHRCMALDEAALSVGIEWSHPQTTRWGNPVFTSPEAMTCLLREGSRPHAREF